MAGRELCVGTILSVSLQELRQFRQLQQQSRREIGLRLRLSPKQEVKVGVSLGCMVSA